MRRNSNAWRIEQERIAADAAKPKILTNWTSPKTNFFAGLNALRTALASGQNAKLEKRWNAECEYPIRVKEKKNEDFRLYESYAGWGASVNSINADTQMTDFQKYLSLNYVQVFGSDEAKKHYYETGEITKDNLQGMGRAHLVNVDDLIKFLTDSGEVSRALIYVKQYRTPENYDKHVFFFDFYRFAGQSEYTIKKFSKKLWVVVTYVNYPKVRIPLLVHILNALAYPFKYIPRHSVLRMDEYTNHTFRIGSVIHGYEVEFQIPKKFSFVD